MLIYKRCGIELHRVGYAESSLKHTQMCSFLKVWWFSQMCISKCASHSSVKCAFTFICHKGTRSLLLKTHFKTRFYLLWLASIKSCPNPLFWSMHQNEYECLDSAFSSSWLMAGRINGSSLKQERKREMGVRFAFIHEIFGLWKSLVSLECLFVFCEAPILGHSTINLITYIHEVHEAVSAPFSSANFCMTDWSRSLAKFSPKRCFYWLLQASLLLKNLLAFDSCT